MKYFAKNFVFNKMFCIFALGIPHQCREKQGGTQETDVKPRHTDKRDANNISLFSYKKPLISFRYLLFLNSE